jgi:hypothetical protein
MLFQNNRNTVSSSFFSHIFGFAGVSLLYEHINASKCRFGEDVMKPTFRRCPQENNIFLAIVFGYLLKSLKLLSQLKLPEIGVKSFH